MFGARLVLRERFMKIWWIFYAINVLLLMISSVIESFRLLKVSTLYSNPTSFTIDMFLLMQQMILYLNFLRLNMGSEFRINDMGYTIFTVVETVSDSVTNIAPFIILFSLVILMMKYFAIIVVSDINEKLIYQTRPPERVTVNYQFSTETTFLLFCLGEIFIFSLNYFS